MTKEDVDLVHQAASRLAENFDSVIILVTVNEEGVTRSQSSRRGNYFASKGLMQDWLDDEKNKELAQTVRLISDNNDIE